MKTSIFIRVCASLVIGAGVIFAANAETITWTGGVGLWFDTTKWDLGRTPTGDDDVVIANGTVEYVPGGDLYVNAGASLTIKSGGKWFQSGGGAWVQNKGTITVEDGGVFNMGTCLKINNSGTIDVKAGGIFYKRNNGIDGGTTTGEGTITEGSEEKTWNGSDGTWDTAANWSPAGVPSTSDIVTIPSGTVEFTTTGDFEVGAKGSLTICGGAKWFQADTKGSWVQIKGKLTIEDGGIFDMGGSGWMNMESTGSVDVQKGGLLYLRAKCVQSTPSSWPGKFQVDGTIDWKGDTLDLSGNMNKTWVANFTYGEKALNRNLAGIKLNGGTDLGTRGNVEFGGFTMATEGAITIQSGKWTFTSAATNGIFTAATAPANSYINIPEGAKVELLFQNEAITPANAYEKLGGFLRIGGVAFEDEEAFRKAFAVTGSVGNTRVRSWNVPPMCIRIQ